MKVKLILLPVLMIFISLFSSCDEVQQPFEKNVNPDTNITKDTPCILLEEFTGYKCINCPKATRMLHELINNSYKDKVIVVAFHAGNFAKPDADAESHFQYDFRTDVGNELNSFFSVTSNPSATINRTPYQSGIVVNWGNWASAIQDYFEKNKTAPVKINLTSNFNRDKNTLTANVDLEYLQAESAGNYLSVWVTENGIKYWQLDREADPKEVENYIHNHVFRHSFNGTWGDQISTSEIPVGTKVSKNYSFTFYKSCDWKPGNLNVVAFVYDANAGKKVLQAAETKVIVKD